MHFLAGKGCPEICFHKQIMQMKCPFHRKNGEDGYQYVFTEIGGEDTLKERGKGKGINGGLFPNIGEKFPNQRRRNFSIL
jgi:hypothetical protein